MAQTVRLDIRPYPRQAEFFAARQRFVAYGGSRGGGKSWAARTKCVLLALNHPGMQILLLRRTLPELRENHTFPLRRMLRDIAQYRATDNLFQFHNGSRIRLGYCAGEGDVLQYQGQAYEAIFLEEATHFTHFQFQALMECNRLSGLMQGDFRPRMYLTCNPGGVGHAWVKRLFIDREYRPEERGEDFAFIPASVYDNAFLMTRNPGYIRDLESLPEDRRRAMLYGDWDVFEGQYFREFSREKHVCPPFALPDHWRVYRALDYGLDMLACLWVAQSPGGEFVVFRELCAPDLPIGEAARRILGAGQEPVLMTLAPPDLMGRSQESGISRGELFRRAGLSFTPANNDREAGWLALKELLARPGGLRIFSTCTNLIKSLPALCHDTLRPSDVARHPHDITHAPDALRYFVASRRPALGIPEASSLSWQEDNLIHYGRDLT